MSSELEAASTKKHNLTCQMVCLQVIDLNELGADLEPLTAYLKGCKKAFQASQLYSVVERRKFTDETRRLSGWL